MTIMPAISVRQPWAWAIIHAGKDIENRSWFTTRRGPVLIHASKMLDGRREDAYADVLRWAERAGIEPPKSIDDLPLGGIVGVVNIVGCVDHSGSDWFFGPYGFELRNATPLPFHPCKSKLSFFNVDVPYEVPA